MVFAFAFVPVPMFIIVIGRTHRFEIGDHIAAIIGVAQANKAHPGARHETMRVLDPGVERVVIPDQARLAQCPRVAEVFRTGGGAAVYIVKIGPDRISSAFIDGVAGLAAAKLALSIGEIGIA